MNKTLTILIDNGHGIDTKGKHSPLVEPVSEVLFEWLYTRDIARKMVSISEEKGLHAVLLVPENEDVPLRVRAQRANEYIKSHPQERCVLFSIHGNAAGDGKEWKTARGFEAWTTIGQNRSDTLAMLLYEQVRLFLPEIKVRKDSTDGDDDKEENFTVIKLANCPAVLSECLFYDNKEDLALMKSEKVKIYFAEAHVMAAMQYNFFCNE